MKSKALEGVDALLATVMMPPGVPVATVGIDGAKNAAVLAVQMLSLADEELAAKLAAEKADVVSFAEREVLIPLEEHRQHLQSLRAVNQQMLFSLAMLRETNAALIQNIQQITLATRGILAATSLRTTPDGPASEDLSLNDSLEELSRALDAHTAWRKENLAKRSEALQELQNLSSEAFGSSDYVS